ncbi:hypothetical protein FMUAM8_22370 [Nocardia cyriacigeorgica]|nr:hypothetical protein FMUAM8_22370 [Nocardia cyriacigeorgica]
MRTPIALAGLRACRGMRTIPATRYGTSASRVLGRRRNTGLNLALRAFPDRMPPSSGVARQDGSRKSPWSQDSVTSPTRLPGTPTATVAAEQAWRHKRLSVPSLIAGT